MKRTLSAYSHGSIRHIREPRANLFATQIVDTRAQPGGAMPVIGLMRHPAGKHDARHLKKSGKHNLATT